jgi:glycerol uptake facilitator-like aquaporin
MEMDNRKMMAECVGSLTVTLVVWGTALAAGDNADAPHQGAVAAGAAGVTLAIMWMVFRGSEILPILTIGNMASGRTEWQNGALNFSMQILGALIAGAIMAWQGAEVFNSDGVELTSTGAAMALIGGFLLMVVWDRLGGGWESGAFAAVLILAGISLASASSIGGMVVEGAWDGSNFFAVFGTLICAGLGAWLATEFGSKVLGEEE